MNIKKLLTLVSLSIIFFACSSDDGAPEQTDTMIIDEAPEQTNTIIINTIESSKKLAFTDETITLNIDASGFSNLEITSNNEDTSITRINETTYNVNSTSAADILVNLNVNKATGPDEISHRILKETHSTICEPLRILFNRSMQEHSYPSSWKLANVMPLFKKGDHDTPSNYRPISLISCVGKVMERVIFKHMYNFFTLML